MEKLYKSLIDNVNGLNSCVMLTYLDFNGDKEGSISDKVLLTEENFKNRTLSLGDDVNEKIALSFETGLLQTVNINEKRMLLIEPFLPKPRLVIFGGGHIAKPLSELAPKVGFSVTVVDDREFFANKERFPDADNVICTSFENSFNLINFRKSDFVVMVTRGHRYDGIVLREVLKHELTYMGMIGSKRRVKGMKDELLEEGFSKEKLDMLSAPIGVDIGAVTPYEIAVSIIAQLISFKNKSIIDRFGKNYSVPEFDIEVAEKIYEESKMPKAILTILSTKGSVPRKAGAKMVAYFDGRTVGSIGGGCSESGVITKAKRLMMDKGFFIEHVNMTGEVAESEGMVCGGVMDVLVEVL